MRTFDEIYEQAKNDADATHVLLGNGFSIGCDPSFQYQNLLDRADFGSRGRSHRVRKAFEGLATADFEQVIRRIEDSERTVRLYRKLADVGQLRQLMKRDVVRVRDVLAETLADVHPDRIGRIGDQRLDNAHDFLKQFSEVFTLNYDLLTYWAVLRKDRAHFQDGFRRRDDRLVHCEPDTQNVFHMHGAIHLHDELVAGNVPLTVKKEWVPAMPLVDAIRTDLEDGVFPLVVTEGTWQQKQARINSSPYLSHCQRRLREASGALVTFGWALSPNDLHVLSAIEQSRIDTLYVGLWGDEHEATNPDTIGTAKAVQARTRGGVTVEFWDTRTVAVW